MAVYVAFPVIMFATFNQPWFYEDAIYQARMAIQMKRDEAGVELLKRQLAHAKQVNLQKSIEEREEGR